MVAAAKRKHLYGLTIEAHKALLESQGGVCAICRQCDVKRGSKTIDLCVDHDHETDEVRGLLCWRCNGALGMFEDDVDRLRSAIDYLEK